VEDSMTKSTSASNSNDVYVLALSSRPDLIDAALLRPGRIEKHVYVGYPSSQEREDILRVLLQDHLSNELDLKSVIAEIIRNGSERLEAFTPADLKALVDSAYLQAVHETISKISATALATTSPSSSSPSDANAYVTLTHLKTALSSTRSSISDTDRDFFDRIFSKFRNLPSPKIDNDTHKLRVALV
jgi:SpoVK/Ycf46/Vps4 family AAA+-type ATPase